MFRNKTKISPEEKDELDKLAAIAFQSRSKSQMVKIFDRDVLFITQDYSKPESVLKFDEPIKTFETYMNFVTIASAYAKDVFIEEYQFTEKTRVFIDYPMTRLIAFDLEPMSLQEMIWNISKIYTEIFKKFIKEARVCCNGYEFLYLKKLRVHNDNIISLVIDEKIQEA